MNILEKFSKFLNELNLFLIPLYFIQNNVCSCKSGSQCRSPGKHPRSLSWKTQSQEKYEKEKLYGLVNHADNDKNILKYLYECAVGKQNLAVTTGKYSKEKKKYLIVVDVDLAKAKDELVKKNLESLCEALSKKTFHYKTGSGGYHFWVWSDKLLKNSAGKLYENIDIRGENGYVVIPPSNHISGGEYSILSEESFDLGIKDIKVFYDEISKISKKDRKERVKAYSSESCIVSSGNENQNENSDEKICESIKITGEIKAALLNRGASGDEIRYWSSRDIKKIKEDLNLGNKKIPEGIRNNTIYRLLSSDHHLGTSKSQLKTNALKYQRFCENMNTLSSVELFDMADRISKYKIFKNDRDVLYDFYLMTQETSIYPFSEEDYKLLIKLDNHFFNALEVSDEPSKITDLIKSRTRNMRLFTKRFPEYNQACFAHQLKKRGFIKTRKGGKCTWNIKFNFNKFIRGNPFLENEQPENTIPKSLISRKVFNREVWHKEKKLNIEKHHDSVNLFTPAEETRVLHMTIQNKEVTLKIKNKKHPSASRYPGRANYEVNKTFTPFLLNLSDEEIQKFDNFELFLEETEAREEFSTVQVGDKIGFLAKYENGMVSSIGEVLEIKNDTFILQDQYSKEEIQLGFAEASVGRVVGYFEILYRDDKPYGLPEEEEVTVNVQWDDGEQAETPQTPENTSEDVPDTPSSEDKTPLETLAEKAGSPTGGILAAANKAKKKASEKKTKKAP